MVNYGFVLLPLYIYPGSKGVNWNPLFTAAANNPSLTFQAVINPGNGPGGSLNSCPDSNTMYALNKLHSYPNIQALGYVHTAQYYNCGSSGEDICPCTQPLSALETNITTYQDWTKCSTTMDLHMDGIFFDEAPTVAANVSYMQTITSFAKSTLTKGAKTALFNSGSTVDPGYWAVADYINVFEDTEAAYDAADIGALDGQGVYSQQATMIIHTYTDPVAGIQNDVQTIMSIKNDAMAGLFISDVAVTATTNPYTGFSASTWSAFCGDMEKVVLANANAAS